MEIRIDETYEKHVFPVAAMKLTVSGFPVNE